MTEGRPLPLGRPDRVLLGIARGALIVSLALGTVLLGAAWLLSSIGLLLLAATLLLPIPAGVRLARSFIARNRLDAAITTLCGNLWLITLVMGALGWRVLPVTVASGLVPIVFAAAFCRGDPLRRILTASVGVLAAASFVSLGMWAPLALDISWLRGVEVAVMLAVVAVIAVSVWQVSLRISLTEARVEATDRRRRAVTSSLRASEEVGEELSRDKRDLERSVGELSELNELARILNSTLDLDRVLQATLEAVQRVVSVDHMGIFRLDATGTYMRLDRLVGRSPDGTDMERLRAVGFPMESEDSAIVAAAKMGRTAYFARVAEQLLSPTDWAFYRLNPVKTVLFCPLEIQGELMGGAFFANTDEFVDLSIEDMQTLERYSVSIATAVNNAGLFEEVRTARRRMARELDVGRSIQSGFFPASLPKGANYEVAAVFEPAREMSGDFYDALELGDGGSHIGLVVADVCDKGVGAALFMSIFRSLIRATAMAEADASGEQLDPEHLLLHTVTTTNDYVADNHGDASMFATLFIAVVDTRDGTLWYVNGGHEAPVICGAYGVRSRLVPTGPAVGMLTGMEFTVEKAVIESDETLVVFTDGATEAQDEAGRLFTEERLLGLLAQPQPTAAAILEGVRERVSRHVGPREPFDDITLLALRRSAA